MERRKKEKKEREKKWANLYPRSKSGTCSNLLKFSYRKFLLAAKIERAEYQNSRELPAAAL